MAGVTTGAATVAVRHNEAARRFEADVDGGLARADYRMQGDVMGIVHTEVPMAAEGRGIAGQVVRAALAHAREKGLRVAPMCSYVRAYMQRHPETHDLLPANVRL
jgi:predicted GNAT family acetyltransferase